MPKSATTASAISGIVNVAVSAAMVAGVPLSTGQESIEPAVFQPGSETNTASIPETQNPLEPTEITELPEEDAEGFVLLRPIPVAFKRAAAGNLEAHVPGADLAFTGVNREDAKEHLLDWMVGLFEDLSHEDPAILDPRPTRQLETLRQYLDRA